MIWLPTLPQAVVKSTPKAIPALPIMPVPASQAQAKDVFDGDPFPKPWVDPGYKKFVFVYSPNYGRRPDNMVIDTVVVHSTVIPTLEKSALAFYLKKSQVSAHFVIGRDGSIVQCVPTYFRAWHAGVSRDSHGRNNVNDYSIGIELVNLDNGKDPYPDAQVEALKALIRVLKEFNPIKYVTSHEYIALPHGRKNDPAGFPWSKMDDLGLQITYKGVPPAAVAK